MKFNDNSFRFSFAEAVVLKENLDAEIGTVTTGDPDSEAEVTLSRNGNKLIFSFSIPKGESGAGAVIDSAMSDSSLNPVQNSAIKAYIDQTTAQLELDLSELYDVVNTICFTPVLPMQSSDAEQTLLENVFYVFPEMASLSVTLAAPSDTSVVNEYKFRFTSGATATTLTLPSSIIGDITIEANKVYEISIIDNYLAYQSWAVSA